MAARRHAGVRILTGVVVVVLLAACADAAASPAAVDPEGEWELVRGTVSGQEVPIPDGQPITLTIDGSSIRGRVCNTFGGRLTLSGGELQVGTLESTAMACLHEDLMTAEMLVMTGLSSARSIAVEDGELVIRGPGAELRYVRAGAQPRG